MLASCGDSNDDASAYVVRNLVTDTAGGPYSSTNQDRNLVNAWGVAFNPQASSGSPTTRPRPRRCTTAMACRNRWSSAFPPGTAGQAQPTGIVFNGADGLPGHARGRHGASAFIFVGEAGTVAGWSPSVNLNNAVTVFDGGASGTSYQRPRAGRRAGARRLYASDFHNGRVDVFDAGFNKLALPAGAFIDPALPAGYAPFGIQAIGNQIYVAYAQAGRPAADEVAGAGLGVVDVFDTAGNLVKRLICRRHAERALGHGDGAGRLRSLQQRAARRQLRRRQDQCVRCRRPAASWARCRPRRVLPIAIDGLWGIAFGNGINAQPTNTLFFAAGPSDETHGVYGRIDVQ